MTASSRDVPAPRAGGRHVDRPLTDADIGAVVAMESAACLHPLHAWTADNYRSSLRAGYWARVRCEADTGRVIAVVVAMDGHQEVHLLNIAVAPDQQGLGMARELLDTLAARCVQQQAEALWLEVRPSNTRARALYERLGFEAVGLRKHYYPAPEGREDAIVMRLTLPALHAGGADALE
ncbi:ribosomal protein S18-alanine N-acetyltransferase [uncultured Aquabacterium sp.]|uniref:ribosomal protein S18-alanine N-acetyltransferase n=1 Tax=Aquabacterium sp. TaxID=1872578 RepID=UPI0025F87261|nr:ribosomal protein S18-alanine N-acetyltransferase [uncultured Aquabacterium sp.]